jgi:PPOX class probable F420-dependent enzyme
MMNELFSERQSRFLEKPRIARLATVRRDGSPHVAPVWYRFDAGQFLVLTERGSQKHKNVERDPRVELCIDDERPPYHTVLLRARVTVEEAPGREWREALAVHYLGEEAGMRYIAENMHPNNVMLRMVPQKVTSW